MNNQVIGNIILERASAPIDLNVIAEHNGKALDKLTEDFAEKTREALKAGVSAETLQKIITEEKEKMEGKG